MPEKVMVLIYYGDKLSEALVQQVRGVSEGIEVTVVDDEKAALKAVVDAEVVFGRFNKELFSAAKKLRWVQTKGAGVDGFLFPELVDSNVVLTNSSGIHMIPISEMIVTMMLVFTKRLHLFMKYKHDAKWQPHTPDELLGKTLGIVGLGNIGSETAKKAKCLGMKILALKKHPTRKPDYVDELYGSEGLKSLLNQSDFVVITLPLTNETRHMIGVEQFRLMKPTAYIINTGRGAVIDTEALLKALKKGWIAGAGLDVFEKEPLPADSELWKLDNIVITPHVSGGTPYYDERAVKIFCDNLKRYLKGKPLRNVVNKKAGY
jgi:phosphoglycerate dehydrogenase-like enzyme